MTFRFNTLLIDAGISPADVRLLRHKDKNAAKGRTPYELWRDDPTAFEFYQATQSFEKRPRLRAPLWASFVVAPAGETLFNGLYLSKYLGVNEADRPWSHAVGVDLAGTCDIYALERDERLNEFSGRLVIDWGDGERSWVQRADNQNKTVIELRQEFREPEFPGYTRFISVLSKIETLSPSWVVALRASRGVYLLTCPQTKEQYVGSATGTDSFHGRWLSYFRDGHGGNVGLKSRDPSDYQVSILEVAGSMTTPDEILAMERLWKQKLQSREMGLNRN